MHSCYSKQRVNSCYSNTIFKRLPLITIFLNISFYSNQVQVFKKSLSMPTIVSIPFFKIYNTHRLNVSHVNNALNRLFYSSLLPKYLVLKQHSIHIPIYKAKPSSQMSTRAFRLSAMWLCERDTAFCNKVALVVFAVGVDCLISFSNQTDVYKKSMASNFLIRVHMSTLSLNKLNCGRSDIYIYIVITIIDERYNIMNK